MNTEEPQPAWLGVRAEEQRNPAAIFRRKLPVVFSSAFLLCFTIASLAGAVDTHPKGDHQFSFMRPGIDASASVDCCPHINAPWNVTKGLTLPALIGIGAEKCGSTYLSSLLALHPQMQMANVKEVHFLDKNFQQGAVEFALGMYLNSWEANRVSATEGPDSRKQHVVQFEVTPNYIYIPSAACRAKALFPSTKFVVVLRDPADRAYSQFTMFRNVCPREHNKGVVCPYVHKRFYDIIQEGMALLQVRNCTFNTGRPTRSWNDCFGCLINDRSITQYCHGRWYLFNEGRKRQHCLDFASDIISRGLYAAQISWWFYHFSPDQFLFLSANDLFENPVDELNRVADFIGLDVPFTYKMVKANVEKEINKGKYRFNDTLVEETKQILREFYQQPNEDLYELLRVNGHSFRRFDGVDDAASREEVDAVLM